MSEHKKSEIIWLEPDYEGYFDDTDENLIAAGFKQVIEATPETLHASELVGALKACIKQCDFASEILTLTHPELSNVEMNTLTTRQYALWSRSAKSDAVEQARELLAKIRRGGGNNAD